MANRRHGSSRRDTSRVEGRFVALPHDVLDSRAYRSLSHTARSLLLDIARQITEGNNGRLLASAAHLRKQGWRSSDVIFRAKKELLEARLLFETVKGWRPNKASWYAVTWRKLDRHPDYDADAALFRRGAYHDLEPVLDKLLHPSCGATVIRVAPSGESVVPPAAPRGGAISAPDRRSPAPAHGDHLDMPSTELLTEEAS